jgi:tetratricopeptide (TPR) repeat protein
LALGQLLRHQQDFASSMIHLAAASQLALAANEMSYYGDVLYEQGLLAFDENKFADAIQFFRMALEIEANGKRTKEHGLSHYWIGRANIKLSQTESAEKEFRHALVLAQVAKDTVTEAKICSQLSHLYRKLEQLDLADAFYEQELVLMELLLHHLERLESTRELHVDFHEVASRRETLSSLPEFVL